MCLSASEGLQTVQYPNCYKMSKHYLKSAIETNWIFTMLMCKTGSRHLLNVIVKNIYSTTTTKKVTNDVVDMLKCTSLLGMEDLYEL